MAAIGWRGILLLEATEIIFRSRSNYILLLKEQSPHTEEKIEDAISKENC
jgi:hypothetical protein